MLTDPQVYTVNTVAKSMPRVSSVGSSSQYQMPDNLFSLKITHSSVRRDKKLRQKHLLLFTQRKQVTDPITSITDLDDCTISVQVDRPEVGWTDVEIFQLVDAVKAKLIQAYVTQLYGRES